MRVEWIVIALAAAIGLYAVIVFNRLVRGRNLVREAWSGIDVQLHRRSDLIPNLVKTVKSYAAHERALFADIATKRTPAILPALVPSVLAAFASSGFSWLQAPTREGRRPMDQIDGFKQYLSVAEEDRLEYLNPPEKTPDLFERFLPYAIALNVENTWAKRFTGVLAVAGVGAAVSSWYTGDHASTDNITSFANRLGDGLLNTISSAATPPGSSGAGGGASGGSSGGGSSGGGGGGGGGGGSGW